MAIVSVSNNLGIQSALLSANAGDIISCAAGSYGDLLLSDNQNAGYGTIPNKVYVVAANPEPGQRPVFNTLDCRGLVNVEFVDLDIEPAQVAGTYDWQVHNNFQRCENVTIRNCNFTGPDSLDPPAYLWMLEGYGQGRCLNVDACQDFTIINNKITNFSHGMGLTGCDRTLVEGNEIWGIWCDSLNFSGMHGFVIQNNYFHDHNHGPDSDDPPVHWDNIQGSTHGMARDSVDVTIHANIIAEWNGSLGSQNIFLRTYGYQLMSGLSTPTVEWQSGVTFTAGDPVASNATNAQTEPYLGYICKLTHTAEAANKPFFGANWQTYWDGPYEWRKIAYRNLTFTENLIYSANSKGIYFEYDIGKTVINNNTILANKNLWLHVDTDETIGIRPPTGTPYHPQDHNIRLEMRNNVASFMPVIGDKPALSTWVMDNNRQVRISTGDRATYFPNSLDATKISDLAASGDVLTQRQGSFLTFPKKFGGGGLGI